MGAFVRGRRACRSRPAADLEPEVARRYSAQARRRMPCAWDPSGQERRDVRVDRGLLPSSWRTTTDWELADNGKDAREAPRRDPDSPDVWTLGDCLAPSHHRRNIVSDVLHRTLVGRMGVRRMVVRHVPRENGFRLPGTIGDIVEVRRMRLGMCEIAVGGGIAWI
ncbi:hypothetical protein B0H15DRAFT_191071 [Mycena belliarum]|uniref:Uncharacterized protein n=1 Tax=Mycena belliarum TaxID=1033014 RepID=A0AAD6XXF0_9AGAR|nr:hypothetical protein B0H15DRAFT_191071 [Mycena belliae]